MTSVPIKKFKRVLVANRGEIALRIIRTLREMGIESVAIYSDTDRSSMHVTMADHAYCIGGNLPSESYLVIEKICEAVRITRADAVHPGFGFLSENPDFAVAIASTGAEFIGPPPSAMVGMGNKITARETMKKHNVPVVPGAVHPLVSLAELKGLAKEIGFPIILKAAAGGGGRGMRVVRKDEDLGDAFEACTREATAYFGNPAVFCERYIDNPRHIEFQVLFDKHGNGVHLHERDCSIQRRHQKLLEEAPSAYLNATQRQRMGEIAVLAGKAVGYVGAGTIEFICDSPDHFYFMEMNTRIQVEHPVTEMITGMDLIKEMVLVAQGHPLPYEQKDVPLRGWAIEVRINAEDPTQGFMPQPGVVKALRMPQGPNVRVESHLYAGYEIPAAYDSMIAKIITWGHDRPEAIARMQRALAELQVEGVPTTAKFHEALLRHPLFVKADIHTQMIERNWDEFAALMQETDDPAMHFAALLAAVLSEAAIGKAPQTAAEDRKTWQEKSRLESAGIW